MSLKIRAWGRCADFEGAARCRLPRCSLQRSEIFAIPTCFDEAFSFFPILHNSGPDRGLTDATLLSHASRVLPSSCWRRWDGDGRRGSVSWHLCVWQLTCAYPQSLLVHILRRAVAGLRFLSYLFSDIVGWSSRNGASRPVLEPAEASGAIMGCLTCHKHYTSAASIPIIMLFQGVAGSDVVRRLPE